MERHPQLNALEGLQLALRHVNRNSPAVLTYKSFRILLCLYNASERGVVFNKRQIMERLQRLESMDSWSATYQLLRLLVIRGYIEQDGQGFGAIIRPSLAGKNYVKAVERYLRNIRWADY